MKNVRLIAVWLLMLALPLQVIAAYAPLARCGDNHAEHHAMAAAADHDHAATGHQHHDNGPSTDSGGHSCCHHVFTGAATAATPGVPEAPRAITPRVSLLSTLYIPELPQRPPRA